MEKYNINANNSLKNEIEKIIEACERKEENEELRKTFFEAPISEEKMQMWEEKSGIAIPESYKDWLRFSEKCRIDGPTATFWGPDDFNSNYVPDDLIVIGEVIGDGEQVCFSKTNGKLVTYFEGRVNNNCENFATVITIVLNILDDGSIESDKSEEKAFLLRIDRLKANLISKLNGSDHDQEIKRQLQEIDEYLIRRSK